MTNIWFHCGQNDIDKTFHCFVKSFEKEGHLFCFKGMLCFTSFHVKDHEYILNYDTTG